jgi:hypothetical protein
MAASALVLTAPFGILLGTHGAGAGSNVQRKKNKKCQSEFCRQTLIIVYPVLLKVVRTVRSLLSSDAVDDRCIIANLSGVGA